MKIRNLLILFFPILFIMLLVILIALYGSIHIPEGKIIASSVSTNGTYQVNAYRWDGGATTDTAIRGEVKSLATGQKRNIYWKYHEYSAEIKWLSDETVIFNGITLNVKNDMYDYRKDEKREAYSR